MTQMDSAVCTALKSPTKRQPCTSWAAGAHPPRLPYLCVLKVGFDFCELLENAPNFNNFARFWSFSSIVK